MKVKQLIRNPKAVDFLLILMVLLLAIAGMAIVGLPPFGLFTSEFIVISGGFASQQGWVSTIVLFALTLVFCGILRHVAVLLLGPAKELPENEKPTFGRFAAVALPLAALVVFSLWVPGDIRQLLEQTAKLILVKP